MDDPATIQERLLLAFPRSVRADVRPAIAEPPWRAVSLSPDDVGPVLLDGEPLSIPARLYCADPAALTAVPHEGTRRAAISCLLSRHADGYVRERHLRTLLPLDPPWVAPFVFAMIGEYVLPIIEVIERAAQEPAQRARLEGFARGAPAFCRLTCHRVVSYWDCYHRTQFPRLSEYPPFRLLDAIGAWPKEEAPVLRRR